MKGKTVVITGANTGIGRATAHALATRGARVFFACRSREKTEPVIEAMRRATGNPELFFHELDLADLAKVRASAKALLATIERLDVLINNAGLVRVRELTAQGFEMTFGVNHLAHLLFTLLLEPALVKAAPSRVVTVASRAHERTSRPIDYASLRRPTASFLGWSEYMQSKLANMLSHFALDRRWRSKGVHTYAVHPGVIASSIWRQAPTPLRQVAMAFMRTEEEGARSSVHCASSDAAGAESGLYYGETGEHRKPSALATDEAAQEALWRWSMEQLAPFVDQ